MKEKIIRATAKLISKKGRNAVSTRAVCSAVGISAPTLYHYFIDKADLLNAVTEVAFAKNKLKKLENLEPEGLGGILQIWDNYIDFAMSEPEFFSVMITTLAQGELHPVGQMCFEQTARYFARAQELNLLTCSGSEAALVYQAAALGVASLTLLNENKDAHLSLSKRTRGLVLQGLLRPGCEFS